LKKRVIGYGWEQPPLALALALLCLRQLRWRLLVADVQYACGQIVHEAVGAQRLGWMNEAAVAAAAAAAEVAAAVAAVESPAAER
jgi:hypothetical protein